ncbi:MAG: hypothetical protein A3G18_04980 [Rhodospirillales bacterium RIFCSPLOWO2_12_FULL_58_28]|nr:MAG: hypothetical protein A3H92_03830 [Rhodospirillales bacterium RIFCSPLOWO2_02_FULL_58_16]OHC78267.1 MAG: hypothetical protein A3G18_04980 [Rhodospirillales bacterium RIFCSPLOWO2_12_FULL_58_28]
MQILISLLCGAMFGLGVAVSGMINPAKVLAFLDAFGAWDPSLLLVMGGALAVTGVAYHFTLKNPKPMMAEKFYLPEKGEIDRPLILGAAIFGVGWGIIGLCPGPAVASIAYGHVESLIFLIAMIVGMTSARRLRAPMGL